MTTPATSRAAIAPPARRAGRARLRLLETFFAKLVRDLPNGGIGLDESLVNRDAFACCGSGWKAWVFFGMGNVKNEGGL